ncbi:hypothetical protein [Sutcliffiella halmapala]|uniref:hypothetical protein n=1 Tax=Sutcliffiella halmapala TaxID=79882 RepID=UPI000994A628|nr:hypothetical protein [Sutcliffiella halmapala]
MTKTKATVALSIFSTLFAGAWWFNTEMKSDFNEQMNNSNSGVVLMNTSQMEGQGSLNVIQPFKPREYIRVVVAKKQEEKKEVEPS